jgi:acyl-CoA synthetase (NDP forming)
MAELSFGKAVFSATKLRDIAGGYAWKLSEEIRKDVALHQVNPEEVYREMGVKEVKNLVSKMKWFLEACEEAHALNEALKDECPRQLILEK